VAITPLFEEIEMSYIGEDGKPVVIKANDERISRNVCPDCII
jgi:hypothetical protein